MRKTLLNLHLYLALVAGVFVVILGVSGSIMAFEEELDRVFNPSLFQVQPQVQPLSLTELMASLKKNYPDQKFNGLRFPSRPDQTYLAAVRGSTFFVNGYTGQVVGARSGMTLLGMIHQLHLRLMMGKVGEAIVAIVTGILVFLVISGIYLWWPVKRATVKFGASTARVMFDLHNVAGLYSAVFLFVLAFTGLYIHFDNELEEWLNRQTDSKPPVRSVPSVVQEGAKPIDPDNAVQAAQAALPGAKPNAFVAPGGPKTSYFVSMRFPEDLTPGGRSWVVVDQYSGKALFVENSRTAVPGTRTTIINRAIHTGDVMGYPSKIIVSLSSLLLVVQAVTGYYMWLKKVRLKTRELESDRSGVSAA